MSHPLQARIAGIRGRARRLTLLYAASWVIGAVLLSVLALAGADYVLRFEDRGIRLICFLTAIGAAAWSVWRFLLPAVSARWNDVEIALRIERRFPDLNDRLASTVQFLAEDESSPAAGSVALRRAVIVQATAEAERIPWDRAIDVRPAARAAVLAAVVCFVTAALAAGDMESATIAARRLFNPLGDLGWPQRHRLAIENPVRRIALGDAFEVSVVDQRGELPEDVQLLVRYAGEDGVADEEALPMRREDGAFVYRREGVRRPFSYRAVGGDDRSMEEIQLEVVEPPAVQDVAVTLHYPAYTGWPPAAGEKNLRALRGTRVAIAATSTKPLRSARLEVENGRATDGVVAEDGYGFSFPVAGTDADFVIDESGSYRLLLEDREGIVGGRDVGYDIRAVADLPPTLTIDDPAANIFVTPDAVVPLVVTAKDDLALREVSLVYLRSDQSDAGDQSTSLYAGPEQAPPRPAATGVEAGETRRIEDYRWELAPLALQPGVQITFHASAADYLPQSGQSQPRRLTVITREELEDHVAERLSFILGELARVVQMQRESRTQVSGLEIQMRDVGQLTKQDLDRLQGAEMTQRQVDRELTSPSEGIPAQVSGLMADLENNKVDSPDIERRMRQLLSEIGRLQDEHLPPLEQALTGAIKGAQLQQPADGANGLPSPDDGEPENEPSDEAAVETPPAPAGEAAAAETADAADESETPAPQAAAENAAEAERPAEETSSPPRRDDPVSASLAAAGEHQNEVIASLERMLGELTQSEAFSRLYRELSGVRREQQELAADAAELAETTLGKETRDLSPQEQADLNKAAERQQELAQRFEQLGERMEQVGESLAETDPLAAAALADALEEARRQGIGPQMQEAARNVEQNQMGQAGQQQGQIDEKLSEVLDVLANRREQELDRLVKKLTEAEAELMEMRERQEGLRKKAEEAAAIPDEEERRRELERLGREQQELAEEMARFARKLERLQAQQAAQTSAGAAEKMSQAGQQGQQGESQGSQEAAEQAKRDLEEAQRQLAERRQQAEADLAVEQLAKIADSIKGLHDRQLAVIGDTERLEDLSEAQAGRLTRAQSQIVQNLSRLEQLLGDETASLAEKVAAAKVFELALRGAAREMARAAELLGQNDVGSPAQTAEQNALRRFAQLLEALNPDSPDPDMQPPQGEQEEQGQGEQGNQAQTDGIPNLAQLKMLELLQREVNDRTLALEEAYGRRGELTEAENQEYLDLSAEQGDLARLLLDLTQPEPEAEEEMDVEIEYDEDGLEGPETPQPEVPQAERPDSEIEVQP